MSGSSVNPSVSKVFSTFKTIKQVVILNNVYKTKYPNPDELYDIPEGMAPMKTHRTSFVSDGEIEWLSSKIGTPAHFMAMTGGFGAGCLIECEMTGRAGYQITLITDGHYVSTESMQAFEPVMSHLGLTSDAVDFSKIAAKPTFRDTLREANQRGNSIFC